MPWRVLAFAFGIWLLQRSADLPAPRRKPGDLAVWSHLHVAEGIELQIEPSLAGLSPEQVRALARGVMALAAEVRAMGNTKPEPHTGD